MLENGGGPDLAEVMKFGEMLRSKRHFEDSLPFFDHVIRHAPDALEARIGKAKSLCDSNEKPSAMAEVDTIKLLAGNSVDRQVRLFELLLHMKAYSYADEIIKPLIRQNPHSFMLRRHYILSCLNRGKPDWALVALDEATSATELTGPEWSFAARSYLQARKPELAARAALRSVGKTTPPALSERLLLAQAYVHYDRTKAIRELDAIADAFDGGSQALLQAAEAYLAVGEKEACRRTIGRIVTFYEGREIPMSTRVTVVRIWGALDDHEQCHALLGTIPIETLSDKSVVRLLHDSVFDLGYYEIAGRAARQGLALSPYDPHYMASHRQIIALGLKDRTVVEKKESSSSKGLLRLFRRA